MADKITELTGEIARDITEAWVATYPNQVDSSRNIDTLRFYLFQNSGTHWYRGVTDDSYFFVSNVVHGHQALLQFISKRGAPALNDWRKVLNIMRDILDEHKLIKLVWMVPGHARRLYDSVKRVKFELEGWLKEGCLINGKPTDLAAMGLFRDVIDLHLESSEKPVARPYHHPRRRRKKTYSHSRAKETKATQG